MKRTAIIHIGLHKTGSTAIQSFLAENKPALAKHGWFYPEFEIKGKTYENHSIPLYFQYCSPAEMDRFWIKRYWALPEKDLADIQASLQEQFQALTAHPRVIFSGEVMSEHSAEDQQKLLHFARANWDEVRVFCYYRNPYDFLTSNLSEKIKGGDGSLEQGLQDLRELSQAKRIQRAMEVYGDALEHYSYDLELEKYGSSYRGFMEHLGLWGLEEWRIPSKGRQNITPDDCSIRFMGHRNTHFPLNEHGARSKGVMYPRLPLVSLKKFNLRPEEFEKVKASVQAESDALNALLGTNYDGKPLRYPLPGYVESDPLLYRAACIEFAWDPRFRDFMLMYFHDAYGLDPLIHSRLFRRATEVSESARAAHPRNLLPATAFMMPKDLPYYELTFRGRLLLFAFKLLKALARTRRHEIRVFLSRWG